MAIKVPGSKLQQNAIEAIFMLQTKMLAMEHLASVFHIMDEFNFSDDSTVDKVFVESVNQVVKTKAQSLKSYKFLKQRTSPEHAQEILTLSTDQVFEKINSLLHVDAVNTGDFFLNSITNDFTDIYNVPNRTDGRRQGIPQIEATYGGLLNSIHQAGSNQEFKKFFVEKYFSAKNTDGEQVLYSVPEFEAAYMATVQTGELTTPSSIEYFHLKDALEKQTHPAFGVIIDKNLVNFEYFEEKVLETIVDHDELKNTGAYDLFPNIQAALVVAKVDIDARISSLEVSHPGLNEILTQFQELDLNEVRAGVRLMYLPEQKKSPAGAATILQEQSITKNSFAYSVKETINESPVYFHPIEICKVESPFQLTIDGELQSILDEVGLTKDDFEFAQKIFDDLSTFSDATFGEIRKHYNICVDGQTHYRFNYKQSFESNGQDYACIQDIGGGQDFFGWAFTDSDTGESFVVSSFQEKQKIYDEFFGKLADIEISYINGDISYPYTKKITVFDTDNFERQLSMSFFRSPLNDTLEFYNKVVENSFDQTNTLISLLTEGVDPDNPGEETEAQKWFADTSAARMHRGDGSGIWDIQPTPEQFQSNYLSNQDFYNGILWNKNLDWFLTGDLHTAYFSNSYHSDINGYSFLHCTVKPDIIPKNASGAVAGSGISLRDHIDGAFFPFLVASNSGFSDFSTYHQTKLGLYKSSFFQYEWMWDRILRSTKTFFNYTERLNALIENHNMLVETRDQQAYIIEILDKLKKVKEKIGYSSDMFPKEFSKMAKTLKHTEEYKKVFKHILPTQALNILLPIYFMKQSAQIRSFIEQSGVFEDINEGLEYIATFYNNPSELYLEGEKE